MKQRVKRMVLMIMLLGMVFAVGSLVGAAGVPLPCLISAKLVNQDPTPAIPNEYVKVLFQVTGLENPECKTGATVKLVTSYPFTLDSGVDSIQSLLGSTFVSGYQTAWMVPYRLRVAADALQAPYQLELLYHPGNSSDFSTGLQGSYTISVADALTNFDAVVQEVSGSQVSLGIVNTGKNTANSLVASIPQQHDFKVVGSTSSQIVGNLAAGDYTIVSFNLASTIQRNVTLMKKNGGAEKSGALSGGNPFSNAGNGFQYGSTNADEGQNQLLKLQLEYTDGIGERRTILKEIPLNGLLLQGNMTGRGTNGGGNRGGATSTTPTWMYVVGLLLIVGGIHYYWRYRKNSINKGTRQHSEKSSEHTPEWVVAEKSKGKN